MNRKLTIVFLSMWVFSSIANAQQLKQIHRQADDWIAKPNLRQRYTRIQELRNQIAEYGCRVLIGEEAKSLATLEGELEELSELGSKVVLTERYVNVIEPAVERGSYTVPGMWTAPGNGEGEAQEQEHSYARDASTNRDVHASDANKTKQYNCLGCNEVLTLCQGDVRAAYYRHRSASNCGGGGPESREHLQAKHLLADDLDKWHFVTACSDCQHDIILHRFPVAEGFSGKVECFCDPFRIDMMVLKDGQNFAALEVFHTHAVGDEKREQLANAGAPVIEVDASQIIAAHEGGNFRAIVLKCADQRCEACEKLKVLRESRPCFQPETLVPTGQTLAVQFEKDRRRALRAKASEIVENDRVNLSGSWQAKEELERLGRVEWDRVARTWYASAKLIERFKAWLPDAGELVPLVKAELARAKEQVKKHRREGPPDVNQPLMTRFLPTRP